MTDVHSLNRLDPSGIKRPVDRHQTPRNTIAANMKRPRKEQGVNIFLAPGWRLISLHQRD